MQIKNLLFFIILMFNFSHLSLASFHEVELHSTEALLTFSSENSTNVEANYLYYLAPSWQLLFGGKYENYGDVSTRSGISLGASYNFGAPDHNDKYYIKPQLTFNNFKAYGSSESVMYLSGVFGKRFPIFKGAYTINYTPSIGVSIPLNNTENFDTIFSVSIVGLSVVF